MIATYRPRSLLRFVRNPYFHEWKRAAQPAGYPDQIDIRIGGTPNEAIRDVVARQGRSRVVGRAVDPVAAVEARDSATGARCTPTRRPNVQALFLNTRIPPFNRLDARKAINFAVDRAAARNAWGGPEHRPADVPDPAAELPRLPPLLPVHGRLEEARNVDGTRPGEGEGARGTLGDARHEGHRLGWSRGKGLQRRGLKVLRSLGYRVAVKSRFYARWNAIADPRNRAQIGFDGWRRRTTRRPFLAVPACASFVLASSDTNASSATRASTAR